MVNKSVGILMLLFSSSNLVADISVEHNKPNYVVSGHRIKLEAKIKSDDSPIDVVRTYFKSEDDRNFVFVDMKCEKEICKSILPSIKKETKAIDYIFLIKDESGKVVKTQTFKLEQKNIDTVPLWQKIDNSDKIFVKTELDVVPEQLDGFDDDNMVIDAVAMATKYGVSVGITGSGGTGAGTGTTVAKMSATGVSNGGTVTATTTTTVSATTAATTGISTTTMLVGGGVAAVGAGVAVASSSSGSGSGSDDADNSITESSTIEALKGGWSSKDSSRSTQQWSMTTDIQDDGGCSYTECAFDSCTDGICSVTLEHGIFTFRSDGGANFSGNIIGKSTDFCVDGHFANGDSGQICWTKE